MQAFGLHMPTKGCMFFYIRHENTCLMANYERSSDSFTDKNKDDNFELTSDNLDVDEEEEKNIDTRNWSEVMEDITKEVVMLNSYDKTWEANKERGNIKYNLQCSFTPDLIRTIQYPDEIDRRVRRKMNNGRQPWLKSGLTVKFELVRTTKGREHMQGDGLRPTSSIVLCACTRKLTRHEGIYKAKGALLTNILKLQSPNFYHTFEGHNFAKIVLNTAIIALANAKICHIIEAAADATMAIMQQGNLFEEYRQGATFTLAPENYDLTGPSDTDEAVWQKISETAKGLFYNALKQPVTKFKVEAPVPSPYFLLL